MTREPCDEALRADIAEAGRQLPVKQAVTQALDAALGSPPAGASWNEVYESVRQQVSQSGVAGGGGAQYGCEVVTTYVPDNVPLRQSTLQLSLDCGTATGVVRTMGEAHERGHFADLTRAFGDFKKGVWSEQRYTDYVEGNSRIPSDVSRRIRDERDRHAGDVTFLAQWLPQAMARYDAACVKC
jgi:hypothetical protein